MQKKYPFLIISIVALLVGIIIGSKFFSKPQILYRDISIPRDSLPQAPLAEIIPKEKFSLKINSDGVLQVGLPSYSGNKYKLLENTTKNGDQIRMTIDGVFEVNPGEPEFGLDFSNPTAVYVPLYKYEENQYTLTITYKEETDVYKIDTKSKPFTITSEKKPSFTVLE